MFAFCVLLSLTCATAWADAGEPAIDVRVSKERVALGEPFHLVVTVRHEGTSSLLWPASLALGPEIEERSRRVETMQDAGGMLRSVGDFTLVVFDTNIASIPGASVEVSDSSGEKKSLQWPASPLAILRMVDREWPVLLPPATPRDAPIRDWSLLIKAAVGMFALIALVIALRLLGRRSRRPRTLVILPVLPPHEQALAALDVIEASGGLDGDEFKPVFQDMSEIFREYLGRRFDFAALDQTSSEIRSRLSSVPDSHEWSDAVNTWLTHCDLVKYAGADVSADEARGALYSARALIERTKESALAQGRPREIARA
ncbi:MAG: hypothetical protein GY811_03245 [Myxococcales bacterium]|nr:hypothetical protein [Myxococcales bacterium]